MRTRAISPSNVSRSMLASAFLLGIHSMLRFATRTTDGFLTVKKPAPQLSGIVATTAVLSMRTVTWKQNRIRQRLQTLRARAATHVTTMLAVLPDKEDNTCVPCQLGLLGVQDAHRVADLCPRHHIVFNLLYEVTSLLFQGPSVRILQAKHAPVASHPRLELSPVRLDFFQKRSASHRQH